MALRWRTINQPHTFITVSESPPQPHIIHTPAKSRSPDYGFLADPHVRNVIVLQRPADVVRSWLLSPAEFLDLRRSNTHASANFKPPRLQDTIEEDDLSYADQYCMVHDLKLDRHRPLIVVEHRELLRRPRTVLKALCAELDLEWDERMLAWPRGGIQGLDGPWAKRYNALLHSHTGFTPEYAAMIDEFLGQPIPAEFDVGCLWLERRVMIGPQCQKNACLGQLLGSRMFGEWIACAIRDCFDQAFLLSVCVADNFDCLLRVCLVSATPNCTRSSRVLLCIQWCVWHVSFGFVLFCLFWVSFWISFKVCSEVIFVFLVCCGQLCSITIASQCQSS